MTKKKFSFSGDEVPRNDFSIIIAYASSPSSLSFELNLKLQRKLSNKVSGSSRDNSNNNNNDDAVGGKTTKCAENCEKWMITYACNKVKSWRRHLVVNG